MSLAWVFQAKCRTMNPNQFWAENLTPGRQDLEAEMLCAGCPVVFECGQDVLGRIDVGVWVDGLWVREGRQVAVVGGSRVGDRRVGVGAGVDVVPHSGVVRAGLVLDWDGEDE